MDKDTIKRFLPCLSNEDVDELHEAANVDSYETAEWLPWYKMSLNRLIGCVARLSVASSLKLGRHSNNDREFIILKAAELYRQHLLFAGIGPREAEDTIERCTKAAEHGMRLFLKGCR